MAEPVAAQTSADHLCVLIHGLWGNPQHMSFVAKALRERHAESKVDILIPKGNSGNFTYDGVELGGERITQEIEDRLEELSRAGNSIKKISIIGYSLGGLVARYAIGLLYSKGWLDKLEATNFTTFASPHLGVRTPMLGFPSYLWNVIGARTLSTSGHQLFLIDSFRDTGRPLLAILSDPGSIFMRGLAKFRNRSLYANIVNDRSAPHYTTMISRVDPYTDMDMIKCNYLPGYNDVILDPACPVAFRSPEEAPDLMERVTAKGQVILSTLPLFFFVPVGMSVFLLNAGYQSFTSQQRIKLHESGKAGIGVSSYRIPLMVQDIQSAVDHMYEGFSASQRNDYMPPGAEEAALRPANPIDPADISLATDEKSSLSKPSLDKAKSIDNQPKFPTLALSPEQFEIIDAMDALGIQKFQVHIHKHRHSHAAIICRRSGPSFDEGKVVARHWLDHGFEA